MDNAMETLAARVTPAIVNVAVTSRGEEQQIQMQGIDPQTFLPLLTILRSPLSRRTR